ncbi:hypothetical protein L596_006422 [Steinernema carpocapsae]|uniref:Uncharacterized protein n=1 Tax=Steinernema carpocapsae TaxID=34508 RepID=A0A4U8V204_STECR|nr:hypothetical protein L596_006422 [Steinernema carpocapsae]
MPCGMGFSLQDQRANLSYFRLRFAPRQIGGIILCPLPKKARKAYQNDISPSLDELERTRRQIARDQLDRFLDKTVEILKKLIHVEKKARKRELTKSCSSKLERFVREVSQYLVDRDSKS